MSFSKAFLSGDSANQHPTNMLCGKETAMPKKRKKNAIQEVVQELMDRVMEKVLSEDPFNADAHRAQRPLYAALVPDEIFKGSHFERRFVTPFGGVWEKLAMVAAIQGLGWAALGHRVIGTVAQIVSGESRKSSIGSSIVQEKQGVRNPTGTRNSNMYLMAEANRFPSRLSVMCTPKTDEAIEKSHSS